MRTIAALERMIEEAKAKYLSLGTPEQVHAFIERYVGPSLAGPDGNLVAPPENSMGTDVAASAHSTVAATGFEPVT